MAVQSGKSSPNHPSRTKRRMIKKRQFMSSLLKTEFPWAVYDCVDGIHCQYCMDSGKTNVFTKDCGRFKKMLLLSMPTLLITVARVGICCSLKNCVFYGKEETTLQQFSDLKLHFGVTRQYRHY